jgi:hypothetical protein
MKNMEIELVMDEPEMIFLSWYESGLYSFQWAINGSSKHLV